LGLRKTYYICSPLFEVVKGEELDSKIFLRKLKINLVVRKRICNFAARK
jgi:hypothetical protein